MLCSAECDLTRPEKPSCAPQGRLRRLRRRCASALIRLFDPAAAAAAAASASAAAAAAASPFSPVSEDPAGALMEAGRRQFSRREFRPRPPTAWAAWQVQIALPIAVHHRPASAPPKRQPPPRHLPPASRRRG